MSSGGMRPPPLVEGDGGDGARGGGFGDPRRQGRVIQRESPVEDEGTGSRRGLVRHGLSRGASGGLDLGGLAVEARAAARDRSRRELRRRGCSGSAPAPAAWRDRSPCLRPPSPGRSPTRRAPACWCASLPRRRLPRSPARRRQGRRNGWHLSLSGLGPLYVSASGDFPDFLNTLSAPPEKCAVPNEKSFRYNISDRSSSSRSTR